MNQGADNIAPQLPAFVLDGPRWRWMLGTGPVFVVDAETMDKALTLHSKPYRRREDDEPMPTVAIISDSDDGPSAILLLDTTTIVKDGSVMTLDHREPASTTPDADPEGEVVELPPFM